jgi:hypothetical protein
MMEIIVKQYFIQQKIKNLDGGSDFYDFRVCGSVTILYSPQPVRLEKIKNILNQSGYLISNWKYKNEKEFRTSDLPEKLNFKNKK